MVIAKHISALLLKLGYAVDISIPASPAAGGCYGCNLTYSLWQEVHGDRY